MSLTSRHGDRVRKTLIGIARRRQRPGSGSLLLGPEGSARVLWPDLHEELQGIPWAVAGAVATRRYMPERATNDLDLVILKKDAGEARRRMGESGMALIGELAIGGSSWRTPSGVLVDVIEGEEEWWGDALEEAAGNQDQQGLPVLTLPYLVLMKLISSRLVDVGDVSRMLGAADDSELDRVREVVGRHASDLLDDLESLIALGKLEHQPPDDQA